MAAILIVMAFGVVCGKLAYTSYLLKSAKSYEDTSLWLTRKALAVSLRDKAEIESLKAQLRARGTNGY